MVREHALDRVRALKAEEGKDPWLVGGGTQAHSLLPEIDRLDPSDETLLSSGVRILTYDRA